jgi:CBS domain-containing protein
MGDDSFLDRREHPMKTAMKCTVTPPVKLASKLVRDVMTEKPVCAESGDSLRDLARLLDENEISGVPVVDDQERLIGVVSRTDLLRRLLEGPVAARSSEDWLDLLTADSVGTFEIDVARLGTIDDVMSIDPVTATTEETVATVAWRLAAARVHRAIVVDPKRRPIGIVTTLDLLKVFPH